MTVATHDKPITVPGSIEEHGGRTTQHRPTVHEVIEVDGRPGKGAVIWTADETHPTADRAKRAAFLAWASGEHLTDDETEEVAS